MINIITILYDIMVEINLMYSEPHNITMKETSAQEVVSGTVMLLEEDPVPA